MRLIIKQPLNDDGRHEELGADVLQSGQPIHLLPCKIEMRTLTNDDRTLTASVDQYFRPYTTTVTATALSKDADDGKINSEDTAVKFDTVDTIAKTDLVDTTAKIDLTDAPVQAHNVDTTDLWHATFRGKPLTGVRLGMPNGYVGVLCNGNNSEGDQNQDYVSDVNLTAECGVTQNMMYWNWDRVPTREDPLLAAFDWVRVSEAMMADSN